MCGIALLAKALGHEVSGSDAKIYPPTSTQLKQHGITLLSGYDPAHLRPSPDCVIVGNMMSRGQAVIEYLLDHKLPYLSGPDWLSRHVLQTQHVLAVSGTHGKTTTTGMLCQILDNAGYTPGFLVGGLTQNFAVSARLGAGRYFVVEADEYDTAFFDKRSKFVHYRPNTLVIGSIEYDHADIFPDIAAIQREFHHLIRTVPGQGLIIAKQNDPRIAEVLEMGCWSSVEYFGDANSTWQIAPLSEDYHYFNILHNAYVAGAIHWDLIGQFNAENALAAIAAAHHVGVAPDQAAAALGAFKPVKRRLEQIADINQIILYDDFAHHPTAIRKTLEALRQRFKGQRIIAVMEPRSNTMRRGVHKNRLANALDLADQVFLFASADLSWDMSEITNRLGNKAHATKTINDLVDAISAIVRAGDRIVTMSNGDCSELQRQLLTALKTRGDE